MLTSALLVSLTALAAAEPAARIPSYRGSEAQRASGRSLLAELRADLDGDFADELAVAERDAKGRISVSILEVIAPEDEDEPLRFERALESEPRAADRVLRFEIRDLAGSPSPELLAVLEERAPDEVMQHVRVLGRTGGGWAVMMRESFLLPKPDATERIALMDATPRVEFEDLDGDGDVELLWTRDPVTLDLVDGAKPASLVIGMKQQVFRFRRGGERYEPEAELRPVDFLPPRLVWTAKASAQVPRIWGTAQAFWGADGDLGTAWAVSSERVETPLGQTLEIGLEGQREVTVVRVVPGCARDAESWDRGDRVRAFTVRLTDGTVIPVDVDRLEDPRPGLRAVGIYPLLGGFGEQLLLLLDRAHSVRGATLQIDRVAPSKAARRLRTQEVCISELSLH